MIIANNTGIFKKACPTPIPLKVLITKPARAINTAWQNEK